jgi:peptidoglycan/xylan/chitin deacetylase (PgdA/CDA1 family)
LFFWCYLETRLTRELDDCAKTLREATGESPRWFRAPAGMANLFLHFLLCDRNLKLIGWSARGFDGLLHNTDAMAKRIFTQARRIVISNLVPGTTYLVRARAIGGSTGASNWTAPGSIMST